MPATRHLKDKEVRQLVKDFTARYPASGQILNSSRNFEEVLVDEDSVVSMDGRPLILRTKLGLFPSLKFDELIGRLPKVIIDMGAVAHVANGAHIMRPGIRQIEDDFSKGDLVVVVDEKFRKAIALGLADVDSGTMRSVSKGKVIANIHYVGDEIWGAFSVSKTR